MNRRGFLMLSDTAGGSCFIPAAIAGLQHRLNELKTGARIVMA